MLRNMHIRVRARLLYTLNSPGPTTSSKRSSTVNGNSSRSVPFSSVRDSLLARRRDEPKNDETVKCCGEKQRRTLTSNAGIQLADTCSTAAGLRAATTHCYGCYGCPGVHNGDLHKDKRRNQRPYYYDYCCTVAHKLVDPSGAHPHNSLI